MNDVASSAEAGRASFDDRSVTGVGMEEKHSRRMRMRKTVMVAVAVVVVVAAAGVGRQRLVEDQPETFPFLACGDHPELGSYGGHRCRFELERRSYHGRRMPAPGSESSSNQSCGVPEVRGRATSPSVRDR